MRNRALFALLGFAAALLLLASFASPAQTPPAPSRPRPSAGKPASGQPVETRQAPSIPPGHRLLSFEEGQAIAQGIAWADDEEGLAPDCSHLVHTLYGQSGHPYPYVTSMDLYKGTASFARVRAAQPGDLIVWQGHVGIVVNPREHSFFSSVTAGTQVQNYRSAYWQARGYPRFYRYLTKSSGATTEAARRSGPPPKQQAVLGQAANQPSLRAVKTAPAATESPTRARGAPDKARAENSSQTSPRLILIRSREKQPKAEEVTAALESANLETGEMLRAGNLEKLERPVVVYRQLEVRGVELKGKRGMAEIQVLTLAALTSERMEPQLGWESHQLELQQTKQGWMMVEGSEIAYVPRDRAMRVLAERLAALTASTERSTETDREQAEIVRFMSLLVD